MTRKVDVLVIGAGPTGVGAAVRSTELGLDHLIVDRFDTVGGMARSIRDEHGFTWDLGGHVIHSHFPSFDKAIAAAGTPMLSVRRNGWVWTEGRLVPAPLQQHLSELPPDLAPDAPAANLAQYYRNQFGAELSRVFFEPYTAKMWAQPAELVAHDWTSLRGGSGARNVPKLGLAVDRVEQPPEYFPYPEGGTGRLWTDIASALLDPASFRLSTEVLSLDCDARTAVLSDGTVIEYDSCVTTAPVTSVMGWAGIDVPVQPALVTSTVHAIGFGMSGPAPEALADKSYLFCADPEVPWYRATMLSNYDPGNAGPGRWNVLCEVSTSSANPVTAEEATRRSWASLEALGADASAVRSTWTTLVPMGYPVPMLGRDDILLDADARLRALGIRSRGRFGGWRYESCNQDYSFAQGIEAVDNIVHGTPEDVYWRPEIF